MAIRLPLTNVLDQTSTGLANPSIQTYTVLLPQDTDGIVVKVPSASIAGSGATAQVFVQTTDDGGTTWYDVARLNDITQGAVSNANALWMSIPTFGYGQRSFTTAGSGLGGGMAASIGGTTGNASAFSAAVGTYTGLPIMSPNLRVAIRYTGTIDYNNGTRVQVKVSQQAATA